MGCEEAEFVEEVGFGAADTLTPLHNRLKAEAGEVALALIEEAGL